MNLSDFTSLAPGQLVPIEDGSSAFVPYPLPPKIEPGWEVVELLEQARQNLGGLESIGQQLPAPELLVRPMLRREAVLSSGIEGTATSVEQLALFEVSPEDAGDPSDARAVANYVRAVTYGLDRLSTLPVSLRLIREAHAELFAGGPGGARPGEFRKRQVFIGSRRLGIGQARFVPPPPREMRTALRQLEIFMSEPQGVSDLVELALIHYQFETIHPFEDGNGRIGRVLIKLLVRQRNILPHPLLSLSAFFLEHRTDYMDRLLAVSQRGEWMEWIQFFLQAVVTQAADASARSRSLIHTRERFRDLVIGDSRSSAALSLVDRLFERPATTAAVAAAELSVSRAAAARAISRLVSIGILREVTGRERNRVYYAPEIIDLMQRQVVE